MHTPKVLTLGVVTLLVAVCALFASIDACGITTHIEVGHRAKFMFDSPLYPQYKALLDKHDDAFQAGNPYPDAYYNSMCNKGKWHDISEDTHWVPFLNYTLSYVKDNYPQPWDANTEKLVAFIFGFAAHQVSDTSWHGHLTGIAEGFLQGMGDVNFGGSTSAAHGVGDFGGDVVANYEFDLSFMTTVLHWYVPTHDLVKIYDGYYNGKSPLKATDIEQCTNWLFLGRLGEKLAVAKVYPKYATESPFLADHYEDYFLGGVNDMALWTNLYFHDVAHSMEQGTDQCAYYRNPMCVRCDNSTTAGPFPQGVDCGKHLPESSNALLDRIEKPNSPHPHSYRDYSQTYGVDPTVVETIQTERGVTFRVKDEFLAELKAAHDTAQAAENLMGEASGTDEKTPEISATISSKVDYAGLGSSAAAGDFNNDGVEDLVIGSPTFSTTSEQHAGRVYILYGSKTFEHDVKSMKIEEHADVTLSGSAFDTYSRFGSAVSTCDANHDGITDLVVSAPTSGLRDLTYSGKVYVFFGSSDSGVSTTPNVVISTTAVHANLGSTLGSGDLDGDGSGDIILGSPFDNGHGTGSVTVFLSSGKNKECLVGGSCNLDKDDADILLKGEKSASWFGASLTVTSYDGAPLLVVGAPYFAHESEQGRGRVTGYKVKPDGQTEVAFTLTGKDKFELFGSSLDVGSVDGKSNTLVVGAPGRTVQGRLTAVKKEWTHAGAVDFYPLGKLKGSLSRTDHVQGFINGDRSFARFGSAVVFADFNGDKIDDLLLSSPHRTSDPTGVLSPFTGHVYGFHGKSDKFFKGDIAGDACSLLSVYHPCPEKASSFHLDSQESKAKFGRSLVAVDINGDGKDDVIAAEPASSKSSRRGGAISLVISK